MRPIGYLYKRVFVAPEFGVPHVTDVYSLSTCLSEDFADYLPFGRHNEYCLFDSPSAIEAMAREHAIPLDGLKLFYYEAHELQYDDDRGEWALWGTSFETNVRPPSAAALEGFDVATFSSGNAPECSPLSCSGVAADVATNAHCLLPTFEAAVRALEEGRFKNTEPGPYRIISDLRSEASWRARARTHG